jgi:hypothetical protein
MPSSRQHAFYTLPSVSSVFGVWPVSRPLSHVAIIDMRVGRFDMVNAAD